eukprot:3998934-Karenia_brevis.AAC.1
MGQKALVQVTPESGDVDGHGWCMLPMGTWIIHLWLNFLDYGIRDGRHTVPRSELTAVMRALLAVEHSGRGAHWGH